MMADNSMLKALEIHFSSGQTSCRPRSCDIYMYCIRFHTVDRSRVERAPSMSRVLPDIIIIIMRRAGARQAARQRRRNARTPTRAIVEPRPGPNLNRAPGPSPARATPVSVSARRRAFLPSRTCIHTYCGDCLAVYAVTQIFPAQRRSPVLSGCILVYLPGSRPPRIAASEADTVATIVLEGPQSFAYRC